MHYVIVPGKPLCGATLDSNNRWRFQHVIHLLYQEFCGFLKNVMVVEKNAEVLKGLKTKGVVTRGSGEGGP